MITLELDDGLTVAAEAQEIPAVAEQAGTLEVRLSKRDFHYFVDHPGRISMECVTDSARLRLQSCYITYDIRRMVAEDFIATVRYEAVRRAA